MMLFISSSCVMLHAHVLTIITAVLCQVANPSPWRITVAGTFFIQVRTSPELVFSMAFSSPVIPRHWTRRSQEGMPTYQWTIHSIKRPWYGCKARLGILLILTSNSVSSLLRIRGEDLVWGWSRTLTRSCFGHRLARLASLSRA